MVSDFDDIKTSIKEIALNGEKFHSLLGFVQKVDLQKFTCTVYTADGLSIFENVRLKEITDTTKKSSGNYLIPVLESRVIIEFIGVYQPYITMVSEVEKVITVIEDLSLNISADGFNLQADKNVNLSVTSDGLSLVNTDKSKDLRTILDDLLDFLANEFQVQTAWGPSGPAMSDSANKLGQFKDDLDVIITKGKGNATS